MKILTEKQKKFFETLAPWASTVSYYTARKAYERINPILTRKGLLPSVVLAFCIHRTSWGRHPAAQPRFQGEGFWRHGNNFSLMHADKNWLKLNRPVIEYGGKVYKSFQELNYCAVDFSDWISLKSDFEELLMSEDPHEQILCLAKYSTNKIYFVLRLVTLLREYDLRRFDPAHGYFKER